MNRFVKETGKEIPTDIIVFDTVFVLEVLLNYFAPQLNMVTQNQLITASIIIILPKRHLML